MSQSRQHTFATLFSEVDAVEIPIIQRDYAQGREQAQDVRRGFLTALSDALVQGAPALDLDFVYGSFEAGTGKILSLLDGQQRLTTLFLLYWYAAMREGYLEDFRRRWTRNGRSRFFYSTRPSSTEFFDALATQAFSLDENQRDSRTLSELLADCNWFFLSWRSDPTVQSCLTMLDAIHEVFDGTSGLYLSLVEEKERRITFHLLNLHDFGLSDDLYIKMNARGKALTPFENFKAWLVGRIAKESWAALFDVAMDQRWIDFFWRLVSLPKAVIEGAPYDDMFLRFMYVMAFFEACKKLGEPSTAQGVTVGWIMRLREARGYFPLRELESNDAFPVDTIQPIAAVLDYFCGAASATEKGIFERALSRQHDYPDLVKLYALVAFIGSPAGTSDLETRAIAQARWGRITSNLIANTRLDDPATTAAAVRGLFGLAGQALHLYEALAKDQTVVSGFNREQVLEEARKATLILQAPEREILFVEAEAHSYLQGRIKFLLDFSTRADSSFDAEAFTRYSTRARAVLGPAILTSKDFLLERALLSIDNYLVDRGSAKFSFCHPNATAFRDRSENWLRVVGRPEFRSLLNRVGKDAESSLRGIIDAASCADWRKYIVADPQLIGYCGERLIHRGTSAIYLLSKKRLSGYYVELRSYALYLELKRNSGELGNVQPRYDQVYDDSYPVLALTLDGQEIKVRYESGAWRCTSPSGDLTTPAALSHFIESRGFTA
jgi:hypothetical protein